MQEVELVRKGILEEVYDVEEFIKLLHPESRIHYELFWRALEYSSETGFIYRIEAGVVLYGLTREGFVIKCVLSDTISWSDERLRKYGNSNLSDDYNAWIKETWEKFEQKAKELGATPGKFEFVRG